MGSKNVISIIIYFESYLGFIGSATIAIRDKLESDYLSSLVRTNFQGCTVEIISGYMARH